MPDLPGLEVRGGQSGRSQTWPRLKMTRFLSRAAQKKKKMKPCDGCRAPGGRKAQQGAEHNRCSAQRWCREKGAQSATAQSAAIRSQHRRGRWGGAEQGAGPSWQSARRNGAEAAAGAGRVAQKQRGFKKKWCLCLPFFFVCPGRIGSVMSCQWQRLCGMLSALCDGTGRFVFLKGFRKEARVLDAGQVGRRACRQGAVAATADRS
jgi:hypothetical protein